MYHFSSANLAVEAGSIVAFKREKKEKNPVQKTLKQQLNLDVFPCHVILVFWVYFGRTYYSVYRASGQIKFWFEMWLCY